MHPDNELLVLRLATQEPSLETPAYGIYVVILLVGLYSGNYLNSTF